ncbi:MAG: hypothetical protein IT238_05140 [Bacteroidia bacterium]|nr:hypothetical protein [Bacteroidia bacterium]MCZ2248320.1 hypothetical protein [Bacteroidia bacterium]
MYQRVIIIFILIFHFGKTYAKLEFSYNYRKAYEHVTALRYNQSLFYIEAEKKANPANNLIMVVENYKICMEILLNENKELLNNYAKTKDKIIKTLESENEKNPYYLYALGEINMQWGFACIKTGEYLSGVLAINKAYKLFTRNAEKYPNFIPQLKSLGLLHSLIGIVPDEYKWAVSILGFKGSLIEGTNELNQYYSVALKDTLYKCFQTEATLIYSIIQINFNPDKNNLNKILQQINSQNQLNPILSFAYADICMHNGNIDEAIYHLQNNTYSETQYLKFHYLNYILGSAKLYRLDNDANVYLEKYIKQFKGQSFLKSACLKLAYFYLVQNNTEKYFYWLKQIDKYGNEMTDEDKEAQKQVNNTALPNIYLLKSRLLFDGGFYHQSHKSLIQLKKEDLMTTRDRLEFIYRLGRIEHKLDNNKKAIYYYKIVLKNGSSYSYYYAANAALNLGNIYEELHDKPKAKYYFEECLKLRNHEYQRSIDQKAKAGLKRLSE